MPFIERNGVKYFTFGKFESGGVIHGIFTRFGGVSPKPWDSLNTGGLSGDSRENVVENRRRIFSALLLPVESIFDVWQVHSSEVISTNIPRVLDAPHIKADSILTNRRGIALFMRFGDCVPILLVDPIKNVIGLVHAGWQGTVGLIAEKTVRRMVIEFGCDPKNIIAGIGPSIGPDHYHVREDVVDKVRLVFGESDRFIKNVKGIKSFDLWQANQCALERAGVTQIEQSGICTACNTEDWFSHRAYNGKTGRFGAVITID